MIGIVDYGMGNIHSVNKALGLFGADTVVTDKPQDLKKCTKLVLPGVGAFEDAMRELDKKNLAAVLKEEVYSGKPFLGICLGMQLLFERSQEAQKTAGLGIIKGEVRKIPAKNLKIPHMGWNRIKPTVENCPLLKGINGNAYLYFCHSYYVWPQDSRVIAAITEYGSQLSAVVWKDNIYGVQFHPEKSQKIGLKIIENFVNLC